MRANKETLSKLRKLYYNLTGSSAVFDDYCFYNFWCDHGSWIQCFWLLKKAIDTILGEGKQPIYRLYDLSTKEALPFENVDGYYQFDTL